MNTLPVPLIDYDMITTIEKIGTFPIHLWSIRDMDRALDEICKKYEPKNPDEVDRLLDLCPYFATIWPSARALGAFMSERKTQFTKKHGIEVGCGLGLPSILASKIGASMVATDFHPDVSYWLKKNTELNQVKIEYIEWNWSDSGTHTGVKPGTYDFVLASDVLYEKQHPESLVRSLAGLLAPGGKIYLSDPGRAYLDRALQEFEALGFHRADFSFSVEESSALPEHRLEKKRSVRVFELSH